MDNLTNCKVNFAVVSFSKRCDHCGRAFTALGNSRDMYDHDTYEFDATCPFCDTKNKFVVDSDDL
jgi:Zn finger protein HypA/HybF involved in hydrogenase expression